MMVLIMTAFIGLLVCLQLPGLLKPGSRRDLWIYLTLMGLVYALLILRVLDIQLPYVTSAIARLFGNYL